MIKKTLTNLSYSLSTQAISILTILLQTFCTSFLKERTSAETLLGKPPTSRSSQPKISRASVKILARLTLIQET